MSEQPAKKIVLNNVLDDLIYSHALLDLPIGNLMKQTYFFHGEIEFPLFCRRVGNSHYQNYKRDIKKKPMEQKIRSGSFCPLIIPTRSVHLTLTSTLKNLFIILLQSWQQLLPKLQERYQEKAKRTEDKIRLLLSFDHTDTFSPFDPNFYLEKFVQHFEDYKIKMSRHYKKQTPTRQAATPKFPDIEEEDDNRDDESDADYSYHNHVDVSPAHSHSRSPFKQMALVGLAHSQLSSFQLVQSTKADANVMGLLVTVGNGKRVTDNGRGYCNWMRITKPLNSPADYYKTELTVVPKFCDIHLANQLGRIL
jgi:hypothetical protein